MNFIELVSIVSIAGMVFLFGKGKPYEMVILMVVSLSLWIWHRYDDVTAIPLDSVVGMIVLYIIAGFLTTLVWHICFLYSVRARYHEFLTSDLFKNTMTYLQESCTKLKEKELDELKNVMGSYDDPHFPHFGRLIYLNAQFNLFSSGSGYKNLFEFGPTIRLSNTHIPCIGWKYHFGDVFWYKSQSCEEYLNKLLPPKVSMFGKVLVFVWVFWPIALTWLVCYRLFPVVVKNLATKLYDGLGEVFFGKV